MQLWYNKRFASVNSALPHLIPSLLITGSTLREYMHGASMYDELFLEGCQSSYTTDMPSRAPKDSSVSHQLQKLAEQLLRHPEEFPGVPGFI